MRWHDTRVSMRCDAIPAALLVSDHSSWLYMWTRLSRRRTSSFYLVFMYESHGCISFSNGTSYYFFHFSDLIRISEIVEYYFLFS